MRAQRLIVKQATVALMSPWYKIASSSSTFSTSPFLSSLSSAIMRRMPTPQAYRSFVSGNNNIGDPSQLDDIFMQKGIIRSKIRKALKDMSPIQRSQEDDAIQSIILEAPWFKSSKRLCLYISSAPLREVDTSRILSEVLSSPSTKEGHSAIRKKVYVPRVEDKFSNMKMLKVSNLDELVMSSMNILEPPPLDSAGIEREDVMEACEPVDLVILPGLAFDQLGRRLGRSGGYYDLFLRNYEELTKKKNWKKPLLVALAYSVQIMDESDMAVTPNDVPVDALVSPAGYIPISPAAWLG